MFKRIAPRKTLCQPFVLGILLVAAPAQASYLTTRLAELLILSDLIVIGKIQTHSKTSYVLSIQQVAKGSWDRPSIEIQKFQDWTCAQRYAPYKNGQQAVLFLHRSKQKPGWYGMGAGNEGEWPVSNGIATYLDSQFGREVRVAWPETWLRKLDQLFYWLNDQPWADPILAPMKRRWIDWRTDRLSRISPPEPNKYQTRELVTAIRDIPACFQVVTSESDSRPISKISVTCDISAFKDRTATHASLAEGLLAYRDLL